MTPWDCSPWQRIVADMDQQAKPANAAVLDPEKQVRSAPSPAETLPTAAAFLRDVESQEVVRQCFADLAFAGATVVHGDIDTAIAELPKRGWPHFLVVDISGLGDPMSHINRLAEIGVPDTEVIVVGESNDIALYRDLKSAGVAEYFYKPLLGALLGRTLVELGRGAGGDHATRGGRLIYVVGVRGGVGATTVATNLAWYFAEARKRGVLLLDLDLYGGDAALQLGAQPSHALWEGLDEPNRIDDLFLERGVVSVTSIFGILAGLEPMSHYNAPHEERVVELLHKLLSRFRYVVVDLPPLLAMSAPGLLRLPASILLVSDASLAAIREVGRWREFLGPPTPERSITHILNKNGTDGAVPEEEMLRVIPRPDVVIPWDRGIVKASLLGTKAVQECSDIRHGMASLSLLLSGAVADRDRPLWKRIFG